MRKPELAIVVLVASVPDDWGWRTVEFHRFEVRRHILNTLRTEPPLRRATPRCRRAVVYVSNRLLRGR